jgi:hypothetical protein
MSWLRRMHDLPGVLLRDVPRYRRALARSGRGRRSDAEGWISLCNRIEQLRVATDGPGVECNWVWGSALHATGVLPVLGRQLLRAALCEWPIAFATQPRVTSDTPLLSFVFAHGGVDRLPQLQRTIRSIFAQQDVPCECIVVDQSPTPLLGQLPAPVVYRHLAKDGVPSGWHKAWAYNIGARLARGRILVFHDGDVCAPEGYAREIVATIEQRGYAAASLQRLLFYLSPEDTHCLERNDEIQSGFTPIMAYQNWKGGTIAIARDAFIGLGGFDEGFVDWGGEDDEFYDRCGALGHRRAGYLPFVHLWHPPQPDRKQSTNPNIADVMPWRMGIAVDARVAELRGRRWGDPRAPDPLISYKSQRHPD